MKTQLAFFIFCTIHFSAHAQQAGISGYVYNSETGQRLYSAHIYWQSAPTHGTVTNQDGVFLLLPHKECNILVISHLGFETTRMNIDNEHQLSIGLQAIPYELAGVTVKPPDDVIEIINRVIARLEQNHPAYPVFYRYFFREVYFSEDSIIHLMGEYTGVMEHKVRHRGFFQNNFTKPYVRARFFSEKGREWLKDHNLVSLGSSITDNPVFNGRSYLNSRRLRNFNFELVGRERIDERIVYVIGFSTTESAKHPRDNYFENSKLYIDTESYAIVREVIQTSIYQRGGTRGNRVQDISYVKSGGKWYLRNVTERRTGGRRGPKYRTTLYNALIDQEPLDYDFMRIGLLMHADLNIVVDEDRFHGHQFAKFNTIPLPDWITSRITKQREAREANKEVQVE